MSFAISTARKTITPQGGYAYMAGYGTDNPRLATGTYTPLQAKCVIIWDNGSPNAIITADILGWPRSLHQAIRAQLTPLASWSSSDIVLLATHTHNGPVLVESLDPYISYGISNIAPVTAYGSTLRSNIVSLVQSALAASRTACTLDYKVTSQGWSYNREGLSYVETSVPVLVARKSNGQPAAVLFSYGCHPVTAGTLTQWDGDYPTEAASKIETTIPGCTALFIPGPAGDQDPAGSRGLPLRAQLGSQLGSSVASAAANQGRSITGPIATSYEETSLPLDITDTPQNLAQVRAIYQIRAANTGLPLAYNRHANKMIGEIDSHSFATTVPLPLQVWKLQGSPLLRMAFTGGELVSGYAVYFRNQYGGSNGLVIGGYANESPCYVPSNELLQPIRTGGSYAGGWSTDFPGVAGQSQVYYGFLGHFRSGGGGVESTMLTALGNQLS